MKFHALFPSLSLAVFLSLATVAPAPGEIIHRWSMGETSGTTLADSVGGSNGTIVVPGGGGGGHSLGGGQVSLDGGAKATSDYVDLGANLIDSLSEVTIEIWATRHSNSDWARLFSFGSGGGTGNSFWLSLARGTNDNRQRLDYQPQTNIDTSLNTSNGTQYHYVVTWRSNGGAELHGDWGTADRGRD